MNDPIIPSVQEDPSRKDRLILVVNGEEFRFLHTAVYGKHPKFSSFANLDEWNRYFSQLEYSKARNYALRRLSAQGYHSTSLANLLKERYIAPNVIHQVITYCQSIGFLNDVAWIQNFVRSHRKKMSLSLIKRKLGAKGINFEPVQFDSDHLEQERESIKHLILTKYRKKNLEDFKERQKVIASLMRRGFSYNEIRDCLLKSYGIISS